MAQENSVRNWFPFTDYDFYAYLASGFLSIFFLDLFFNNSAILLFENWNFIQIALVVSIAYILGQIIATPSSMVLEHFVANFLLVHPKIIQLGSKKPNMLEGFLGKFLIGRYYGPLPESTRDSILKNATQVSSKADLAKNPEAIFQIAYSLARKNTDACVRMDDFRNQYGFARNIAFVFLSALIVLVVQNWNQGIFPACTTPFVLLLLAFIGTFIRFLKFYAAFTAEVLRTFAHTTIPE